MKLAGFQQESEFLNLRAEALDVVRRASGPIDVRARTILIESIANGSRGLSRGALQARSVEKRARYEAGRAVGLQWREVIDGRAADFFVVRLVRDSSHALDDDNLASAFKAVRDGIADALGLSDRDQRVRYVVDQFKGSAVGACVWFALYVKPGAGMFGLPPARAMRRRLRKGQRQRIVAAAPTITRKIRRAR